MEHKRFCLNIHCYTSDGSLAQLVQSSSLEISKSHQACYRWPCFEQGLNQMDSRGPYCDRALWAVWCMFGWGCAKRDVSPCPFCTLPLQLIFTRWLYCVFSLRQRCQDSITAFLKLLVGQGGVLETYLSLESSLGQLYWRGPLLADAVSPQLCTQWSPLFALGSLMASSPSQPCFSHQEHCHLAGVSVWGSCSKATTLPIKCSLWIKN